MITQLYERAASIRERTAHIIATSPIIASDDYSEKRLSHWMQWCATNDQKAFHARLDLESIPREKAILVVSSDSAVGIKAPTWIVTFAWMAARFRASTFQKSYKTEGVIPFEEFFFGIVEEASRICELNSSLDILSDQAILALQSDLVAQLSELASPALYQFFCLFRNETQTSGQSELDTVYYSFKAKWSENDASEFFRIRPVVARIMATSIDNWITNTRKFISRLRRDLDRIDEIFFGGACKSKVINIKARLSDPHNAGQTVWKITWDNGISIVYKPKCLKMDMAWGKLLEWLSAEGAPSSCKSVKCIAQEGYGWVEWVSGSLLCTEKDAKQFAARAGSMLCLINLLGGSDIHAENVVVSDRHPYPIDLETLFQPWSPNNSLLCSASSTMAQAARLLRDSVLTTGYLPSWSLSPNNMLVREGGLNPNNIAAQRVFKFININCDTMTQCRCYMPPISSPNLPIINGRPMEISEFGEELKAGYSAMYLFIMRKKHELVKDGGAISAFKGLVTRVVLRSTQVYSTLLQQSILPGSLSSGIDWSLPFEYIFRWHNAERLPSIQQSDIHDEERRCLERGDIPFFYTQSDSNSLYVSQNAEIKNFFPISGYNSVVSRIYRLNKKDLKNQLDYIHFSCIDNGLGTKHDKLRSFQSHDNMEASDIDILQRCKAIAQTILHEGVYSEKGVAWLGALPLAGYKKGRIEVIGHSLYSGGIGIAVFLSALYSQTKELSHKEGALKAIYALREDLNNSTLLIRGIGIGGGSGIGSLIYGLCLCAQFIRSPDIVNLAFEVSKLISIELIQRDSSYDTMTGVAGALLGFLSLLKIKKSDDVVIKAYTCGEMLLANRVPMATGCSWRTIGGDHLTGMSHGVAGIAMSLMRLYAYSGDDKFREIALNALIYENSLVSSSTQEWPDLRYNAVNHHVSNQWCHGACGIGLSRLAIKNSSPNDHYLDSDINRALTLTLRHDNASSDSLCCGIWGRIEFLTLAGRQGFGDVNIIAESRKLAEKSMKSADLHGTHNWMIGSDRQNPGLFTGIAGIGYGLLRLINPEAFPSVLIWE